jgi:hypothetical protein
VILGTTLTCPGPQIHSFGLEFCKALASLGSGSVGLVR